MPREELETPQTPGRLANPLVVLYGDMVATSWAFKAFLEDVPNIFDQTASKPTEQFTRKVESAGSRRRRKRPLELSRPLRALAKTPCASGQSRLETKATACRDKADDTASARSGLA